MYLSAIFKIQNSFYTGNIKADAVLDTEELMLWYIKHEMVTLIMGKSEIKTTNEYVTLHQYFQLFTDKMKDRIQYYFPNKIAGEIYQEVTRYQLDYVDPDDPKLPEMKLAVKKTQIWINPNISEFRTENLRDIL